MHGEIDQPCLDVTQGRAEGDGAEMFAAVCKLGLVHDPKGSCHSNFVSYGGGCTFWLRAAALTILT